MATAQSIIDSARYDLVDFVDGVGVGIEFDDIELLNYLNRMIGLMDNQLSSLSSDLVHGTDDTLLTTANLDYVDVSSMNSGLWNRIRSVWWDSSTRLEQVSLNYMHYTRKFRRSVLESGESIASGDYIKIIAQNTLDFTTIGAGANTAGTYFTANGAGTLGSGDYVYKYSSARPTIWALEDNKILLPQVAGSVKQMTVHYDKKSATLALTDSMPFGDRFNEFIREMLVLCAKAKKEGVLERSDQALSSMFRSRAMHEEIARGYVRKPYKYWEF
jgi:hypothetical protein